MKRTPVNPFSSAHIKLGGGIDGTSPETAMNPGRLRLALNVEAKPGGGYRRMLGYSKFDDDPVPGEGAILGVHRFGSKVQAFRNVVGSATCSMYESTGLGWTEKKASLAASGKYRCLNYAFSGTQKMYGASGKHKAFQWDGTTWTDLTTGMATDTPTHITAHKKHLFLSFQNSVQNSAIGDPTSWTPLTGATEILQDRDVTGFSALPNGSLGIFTRSGIMFLAGTSSADWVANNLVEFGNNAGAIPDTIQTMGSSVRFTDSRGVIDLTASQTSSDFYDSFVSHDVDKIIEGSWTLATASVVVRAKSQYRLFLSDGTGLILTFNGKNVMITRTEWPDVVRCAVSTEDDSGNELIYFGSDDGYIYKMEDGRSFGGDSITAYAENALSEFGYKSNVKRWHRARFDVGKYGRSGLLVEPRLILDSGGIAGVQDSPEYEGGGTPLGPLATIGQTVLGGLPINEGVMDLEGCSQWLNFRFYSTTDDEEPWEIDGITVGFAPGRGRR